MARGKYRNIVRNENGDATASVDVEIRDANGALIPLYDAATGGSALPNPLSTGTGSPENVGAFEFFTHARDFDITVGAGVDADTFPAQSNATAQYADRAEFIAALSEGAIWDDGDIISDGKVTYIAASGSTIIPDIQDFEPYGFMQPEHFGAVGDGVTDDGSALGLFWSNLTGRNARFAAGVTYRSDSRQSYSGVGNFSLNFNSARIDYSGLPNDNADPDGFVLSLSGSTGTDISIASINEVVDPNNTVEVTVETSSAHGLSVGDEVLLSSDDPADVGHDPINETLGQYVKVKDVVSTTEFTTVEPIYEPLVTNPVMTPINWIENIECTGSLTLIGPGRRPTAEGYGGINMLYGRDINLSTVYTNRIDYQAVSIDSCRRVKTPKLVAIFDPQGGSTAIQYGMTYKNCTTDCVSDLVVSMGGKHSFDWTRNPNPGIGRNSVINQLIAYGTWDAAFSMHGNARDCQVNYVKAINSLYALNIRAPGWRVGDVCGENCSEVLRLTDNPRDLSVGKVSGKNISYVVRAVDVDGWIGRPEADNISIDHVEGQEVSANLINLDFDSLPSVASGDAGAPAVVASDSTSITLDDFVDAGLNVAGALNDSVITVVAAPGGTPQQRTVTSHTRVGGNKLTVSTWSATPVVATATYFVRFIVDGINIGSVEGRNSEFTDIVLRGNIRGARIGRGGIDLQNDTAAAQWLWVRTNTAGNSEVDDLLLGDPAVTNRGAPLIDAGNHDVKIAASLRSDPDGEVVADYDFVGVNSLGLNSTLPSVRWDDATGGGNAFEARAQNGVLDVFSASYEDTNYVLSATFEPAGALTTSNAVVTRDAGDGRYVEETQLQSDPLDVTPGAVLTEGAFGWGDLGATAPNDNLDDIVVSGNYRIDTNAITNTPSLGGGGFSLSTGSNVLHYQFGVDNGAQILAAHPTGEFYTRITDSGVWSDWTLVADGDKLNRSGVGLVAAEGPDIVADLNATDQPAGPSIYAGGITLNRPFGRSGHGIVSRGWEGNAINYNGAGEQSQLFVPRLSASDRPEMYLRALYPDNTWSDWSKVTAEHGRNANGEYVQYPDGTQICWQEVTHNTTIEDASGGAFVNDTSFTATYAEAFVGTPDVQLNVVLPSGSSYNLWMITNDITSTDVSYRIARIQSDAVARDYKVYVKATGRWF